MDLLATVVIGGIVYAGAQAYRKHKQRQTPVWIIEDGQRVKTKAAMVQVPDEQQIERQADFSLNVSTCSLGITLVGILLYEPLILIALPLTIYGALRIFEDTWIVLLERRHAWFLATVGSAAVTIALIAESYLLAALIEWVYFLNQKLMLMITKIYPYYAPSMQQHEVHVGA